MFVEVNKGPNKNGLGARFGPRAAIWEGLHYTDLFNGSQTLEVEIVFAS